MICIMLLLVLTYQYGFSEASTCESKYKCKESKTSATFAYISMNKLNNTKLNGTILSTHYVENTTRCNKLCAMHDGCFSINFGPKNASTFVCQLLGEDRRTNAALLVNTTGWSLFTTASKCDDNPCKPSIERCLPHYRNDSYACVFSNPYHLPLMNFTFDEDNKCSGCKASAYWPGGKRINVPDRITKVMYLPESTKYGNGASLTPVGCLKDLSSAFPGSCDSDGFVFSFWYRTFMRSLGDALLFQSFNNGFYVRINYRNAERKTASWSIYLHTSSYDYRFVNYEGPDASQWIHFVFKFDIANDLFSVFINGIHAFNGEKVTKSRNGDNTQLKVAWKYTSGKKYNAMFDDIVYYNRLLSNEEILNLHKEQATH
ncbi:uncharacterized protein LOC130621723 [Hydractinia symbiolongicarpus]|uniref:uncharacterized protein LOC130621723 n=1 Tax=Hydractinia symbiolongicarpus TaxID=13093 RepID=UPI002550F338|nr:uncharacterized protein LOC130621723 [Hydractinia symbiolongicarpus]